MVLPCEESKILAKGAWVMYIGVFSVLLSFCAMKSSFPIKSKEYTAAWKLVQKESAFRDYLRKPDSAGMFKKAYFVREKSTGEKMVLLLEIASKESFELRVGLMKELSKYASNRHTIVPKLFQYKVLQGDDGTEYVVSVTMSRRCPMDLQRWVIRVGGRVDIRKLMFQFVDLLDVLLEMLDDNLFFTDVKAENIIHCGDTLAFIDLDSVSSRTDALQKRDLALSWPQGEQFYRLQAVVLQKEEDYMGKDGAARSERDHMLLYKFYTLFAFSSMVFQYFWFLTHGKNILKKPGELPKEDYLRKVLSEKFPASERVQRLLMMSWRTFRFVYGEGELKKETVELYAKMWSNRREGKRSEAGEEMPSKKLGKRKRLLF